MAVRLLKSKPKLRRYTDLAAVIHILQTRSLTLLDPEKWDDGNDRVTLAEYKKRRQLKSLLAMCFAECAETYHHWKVFAPGMSGICIEFAKEPLVAAFDQIDGARQQAVEYRITSIGNRGGTWNVEDLPFLKRAPYKPEEEYRVIYCSADDEIKSLDVNINLDWIQRIVLSPWMPASLQESVRTALRRLDGCNSMPIQSTSLISSEAWKRRVEEAV